MQKCKATPEEISYEDATSSGSFVITSTSAILKPMEVGSTMHAMMRRQISGVKKPPGTI